MPFLIPLLFGAATGAYFYNKVDDEFIDPIFGNTNDPLISGKALAVGVVLAAGFIYAKKQRLL